MPGGRVRTEECRGFRLERGAAFLATFYQRTLALAAEVGAALERPGFHPGVASRRQALLIEGRTRPHDLATITGFLRYPHVPLDQKLRTAVAILAARFGGRLHVGDLDTLAQADGEDARTWAHRAMGKEAFDHFVRTAFEPFFFAEAAETSASFVRALLAHSVAWGLLAPRRGMQDLFDSLAVSLPLAYGARVTSIERAGHVFLVRHGGGVVRARTVIAAVPAPVLRQMALPVASDDRKFIDGVEFVPSVRVNFGYDRRGVLHPPAITPAGRGRRAVVGITVVSEWMRDWAPDDQEVVRVSSSGWRSVDLLGRSEPEVAQAVRRDCASVGIFLPDPTWLSVFSEPHAIARTGAGHFSRARQFRSRTRDGLHFAGDWLAGSTIEGAVRSGQYAAGRVLRDLGVEP